MDDMIHLATSHNLLVTFESRFQSMAFHWVDLIFPALNLFLESSWFQISSFSMTSSLYTDMVIFQVLMFWQLWWNLLSIEAKYIGRSPSLEALENL